MLGLKSNHVSKRGHSRRYPTRYTTTVFFMWKPMRQIPYCPYSKRSVLRHYQGCFYFVPFVSDRSAYSMLLTHDDLCKPIQVKQLVVADIVILSAYVVIELCICVWFCQVIIRSAGHFYFVWALLFCDNLQTHLGTLLLGRALLIGTFW